MSNYYVTGDIHGQFGDLKTRVKKNLTENDSLIILGDCGFNYTFNINDMILKNKVNSLGIDIYCVKGNHEARPQFVDGMEKIFSSKLGNYVYQEKEYPHIKYLIDGEVYNFNNYKTLVIGGAYSVDKLYRIRMNYTWFCDEQLSKEEMEEIEAKYCGESFDFVFSHTCPLDWQPTDMFLSSIDQKTVDNSMEIWLNSFKNTIFWKNWIFGHYHVDRIVEPGVEIFYSNVKNLDAFGKE